MLVEDYLLKLQTERQTHLDLTESCIERGGNSTNHRGVLAQYLDTHIYGKPADLCHACHNSKCSNPKHLYWGTRKENTQDSKNNGTHIPFWDKMVEKYGYEEARNKQRRPNNKGGAGNKGVPKTDEHRRKISEAIKLKHAGVTE